MNKTVSPWLPCSRAGSTALGSLTTNPEEELSVKMWQGIPGSSCVPSLTCDLLISGLVECGEEIVVWSQLKPTAGLCRGSCSMILIS
ncbi:hypothetical protein Y1Q_0020004 [Alligator mississippiensis]|uniref:Uncharacterized protein n=1 Tax=Alligator mississippiensis TaxID=8496 RepID=A0A151LYP8_ALLMI|nr:hypothetical protein Y1Q_0020004 [Alligator mississippiensis]